MIIHCHHSHNPVSGEMKRIININNDLISVIDKDVIEIELYSIRYIKYVRNSRFQLSDKVGRKYYVPNIPSLGILNDWYRSLIILFFLLKYKPTCYLEEWSLPRGVNLVRRFCKRCRIAIDIHGAAPEEYLYLHNKPSRELEQSEMYSVNAADFIVCQSDAMKCHLQGKYSLTKDIGVYRCAGDTKVFNYDEASRLEIREKLGYDSDDMVFVYSGGMHAWQKVEDSVIIFDEYHKANSKSKLLVLTKEKEAFASILDKVGLKDLSSAITVVSLGYMDVPKYLCAADVAMLLRDNHVMNSVASPTKLAEYLSCGLPILSTSVSENWVDVDGRKYIMMMELGLSDIDSDAVTDFIKRSSRKAISSYAQAKLSLNTDRTNAYNFIKSIF